MALSLDKTLAQNMVLHRPEHCCWAEAKECKFLRWENDIPRCSLYHLWGHLREYQPWVESPIGQVFASFYPGYDCGDWPQNIPGLDPGGECTFPTEGRCRYG